jgi:nucleotide-binding universal stress UspA family protein
MKILLAVDGSACSEAAARSVADRPWPPGSQVRVLSVFESFALIPVPEVGVFPPELLERVIEEGRARARQAIATAEAHLRGGKTPLEVESRVVEGYPKKVILDEAEAWKADLIVMGSHGYRGMTRLWLGSVSQAVANHADCSVEIVRTRTQA